jgi:hypothetical protein
MGCIAMIWQHFQQQQVEEPAANRVVTPIHYTVPSVCRFKNPTDRLGLEALAKAGTKPVSGQLLGRPPKA